MKTRIMTHSDALDIYLALYSYDLDLHRKVILHHVHYDPFEIFGIQE